MAPAIFPLTFPHDDWLNRGDRDSDLPSVAPTNFQIFKSSSMTGCKDFANGAGIGFK